MSLPTARQWWEPFFSSHDSVVFHLDLTPDVHREAYAFALLDKAEQGRWRRFVHEGAQRRFALCRAALRINLCHRLRCDNRGLAFGYSRHDKPFAIVSGAPTAISFNVSHSGNHGLIAIAPSGRIGVDIEERAMRRDFPRLIEAAFGANEQASLAQASGNVRTELFYKLWTIKESLIKALGTGMSYDPADFEAPESIRNGSTSGTYRFPRITAIEWQVDDLGNEHFAAALAREASPDSHSITDSQIFERLAGFGSQSL